MKQYFNKIEQVFLNAIALSCGNVLFVATPSIFYFNKSL